MVTRRTDRHNENNSTFSFKIMKFVQQRRKIDSLCYLLYNIHQSSLYIRIFLSRDVTLLIKQISSVSAHLTFSPFRIFRLFGKFVDFFIVTHYSFILDGSYNLNNGYFLFKSCNFLQSVPNFPIQCAYKLMYFWSRNVILSLNFVS